MGLKEMKAVSNTGPILHLIEIDLIKALKIFKVIYIPDEVYEELKKKKINKLIKNIKVLKLNPKFKDTSKLFCEQHFIDLGESEAISLALQERIKLFLTDDLEARGVAREYNLEAHGTIGILLRAFKEKIINKKITIKKIRELYEKSSLFITKDLVNYIISEINK